MQRANSLVGRPPPPVAVAAGVHRPPAVLGGAGWAQNQQPAGPGRLPAQPGRVVTPSGRAGPTCDSEHLGSAVETRRQCPFCHAELPVSPAAPPESPRLRRRCSREARRSGVGGGGSRRSVAGRSAVPAPWARGAAWAGCTGRGAVPTRPVTRAAAAANLFPTGGQPAAAADAAAAPFLAGSAGAFGQAAICGCAPPLPPLPWCVAAKGRNESVGWGMRGRALRRRRGLPFKCLILV
jgi:hypothetical protein